MERRSYQRVKACLPLKVRVLSPPHLKPPPSHRALLHHRGSSRGMSDFLSLKGGMWMGITFSR